MNPADNLKLSKSIKLLLLIGTPIGTILLTLALRLIEDSNIFLGLKRSKPIDAIINLGLSINIGIETILIVIIVLSISLNIFLLKRMRLYFNACHQFGKLFYKATLDLSKITKQPVKVRFNNEEMTVDYKSLKDQEKL